MIALLIFIIFFIIMCILAPWIICLYENYLDWSADKYDEIKEKRHKDE